MISSYLEKSDSCARKRERVDLSLGMKNMMKNNIISSKEHAN